MNLIEIDIENYGNSESPAPRSSSSLLGLPGASWSLLEPPGNSSDILEFLAPCSMQHAAWAASHAACRTQPAACSMQPAVLISTPVRGFTGSIPLL